jgi:hypothetical protein
MRQRENYSWKSIESVPLDQDVTLQVTDGHGQPYVLLNPSRLTAVGWASSNKGTQPSVTREVEAIFRPTRPPHSMTAPA